MSGHFGLTIYSSDDTGAVWCKNCFNGEYILGTFIFKEGAYVCYGKSVPTTDGCKGHRPPKENRLSKIDWDSISKSKVCHSPHTEIKKRGG